MNHPDLPDKWPRSKALNLRAIINSLCLCSCGSNAHWECILELLAEAQVHTDQGFYRDKWTEFGAKVLDTWGLIDHGTGIGFAWPTEDGKLLLEFLRDFGTEEHDMKDGSGHPFWSIDQGWNETESATDSYGEWAHVMRERNPLPRC